MKSPKGFTRFLTIAGVYLKDPHTRLRLLSAVKEYAHNKGHLIKGFQSDLRTLVSLIKDWNKGIYTDVSKKPSSLRLRPFSISSHRLIPFPISSVRWASPTTPRLFFLLSIQWSGIGNGAGMIRNERRLRSSRLLSLKFMNNSGEKGFPGNHGGRLHSLLPSSVYKSVVQRLPFNEGLADRTSYDDSRDARGVFSHMHHIVE